MKGMKKVARFERSWVIAFFGFGIGANSFAQTIEQAKMEMVSGNPTRAIVVGGTDNGIYTVHLEDSAGGACGSWTALTGANHPAGAGLNVLYANGFPGTSYTTLRSYSTGTDYRTGFGACTSMCTLAGAPVVTPINLGGSPLPEGYRFSWTFADGPNMVEFVQEVVVQGPFVGATVDNTVIRETHIVRNLGPGSLDFGVRKMWDWAVAAGATFDDGPWFGDCETPSVACDTSMNLTANGSLDGPYPQSYVINNDPASADCPGAVNPQNPAGCAGNPPYLVAGTVSPPSSLSPAPDAPDMLQFNAWPALVGNCWEPALVNNAPCLGGDTAVAYFYGRSAGTNILSAGQQKSFTQYVVAGTDACPQVVEGGIPTVSEWGLIVLALLLLTGAKVYFSMRRSEAAA